MIKVRAQITETVEAPTDYEVSINKSDVLKFHGLKRVSNDDTWNKLIQEYIEGVWDDFLVDEATIINDFYTASVINVSVGSIQIQK